MPSDPGELRIRNRRYRPWVEIAGVMWLVSLIFVIAFVQFVGRPEQIRAYSVLALLSFVVGYCLPAWVLVLAVTERPLPSRRRRPGPSGTGCSDGSGPTTPAGLARPSCSTCSGGWHPGGRRSPF